MTKIPLLAYGALLVTTFAWGTAFVASKIVLAFWPPWAFMGLRFLAGALLFLVVLMIRDELKLPKGAWKKLALLGLFQPSLYFVFETLGLQYSSASSVSIIIASIPAVVALASGFLLKEFLSLRGWLGASLSVVGIGLIVIFDQQPVQQGSSALLGNLFGIGAVFSAVVYTLLTRRLSETLSTWQITGYQLFFAALFFFPGLIIQGARVISQPPPTQVLLSYGFLVVGATFFAFLCFNYALSQIEAPRASVFLNGIPVITVVAAWILLGEVLTPIQILGGIVSILGVVLAGSRNRAKSTQDLKLGFQDPTLEQEIIEPLPPG